MVVRLNKLKVTAGQTPTNFAPHVAQQFWASSARLSLSRDEILFGKVTGSVDKDLVKAFSDKKKLDQICRSF